MLDFIKALAHQAGELIVRERSQPESLSRSFKAGDELVTSADLKADELICTAIRQRFPEHRILSEESEPDVASMDFSGPLWIIDPIDGTVNYAHGHYQVAISIAYIESGDIHTGVVHNPFLGETFWAQRGGGAWLNDRRIQVGAQTELRRCLVATGFPYAKDALQPFVQQLGVVLEHCADVRRLGSAALDICWVAMGRIDAYYESLSVWDFAAAQLIAREAGAQYGHFQAVPAGVNPVFHEKHILVANPQLFPQFRQLLGDAGSYRL